MAEELVNFINDIDNYEQWEMYNLTNNQHLPFIVKPSDIPNVTFLTDWNEADFFHIAIKYNNYFWDGSGKHKTLQSVTKKYTQANNPHWFQTA